MPRDWDNFYYLIGSASAGLIGLMFVVVTLSLGRDRPTMLRAADLYLTPTVAHFAVVLIASAVAMIPDMPAGARGAVFALIVLGGLFYAARAWRGIARARKSADPPHHSDLWCYGIAPSVLQGGLTVVIALAFWMRAGWAPLAMAGFLLALLLLSIRNAWDLITWIAPRRPHP